MSAHIYRDSDSYDSPMNYCSGPLCWEYLSKVMNQLPIDLLCIVSAGNILAVDQRFHSN